MLLFNYQDATGVKNGYTIAAKFTYVDAATRGGRTYLLSEMASPVGTWQPAAAMLGWAFAHGPSLTPVGELVEPGEPAASKPTVAPAGRPDPPPTTSAREPARQPSLAGSAWPGRMSALALVASWAWRNISSKRR